jgi:hypothetical protein
MNHFPFGNVFTKCVYGETKFIHTINNISRLSATEQYPSYQMTRITIQEIASGSEHLVSFYGTITIIHNQMYG